MRGKARSRSTLGALLLLLGTPGFAHAFSMGDIRVDSRLGEVFLAEIPLAVRTDEKPREIEVFMGTQEDYKILELQRHTLISQLQSKVVRDERGWFIRVSSSSPIQDPFFNLLIKTTLGNGSHFRNYSVTLDILPPGQDKGDRASSGMGEGEVHAPTGRAQLPRIPSPSPAGTPPVPGADYRVLVGESLSTIAHGISNGTSWTDSQVMLAIYQKNPHQFLRGDINALMAGSVLNLPSQEEINALSQSAAYGEVRRLKSLPRGARQPATQAAASAMPPKAEVAPPDQETTTPAETTSFDTRMIVHQDDAAVHKGRMTTALPSLEESPPLEPEAPSGGPEEVLPPQDGESASRDTETDSSVTASTEGQATESPPPVEDAVVVEWSTRLTQMQDELKKSEEARERLQSQLKAIHQRLSAMETEKQMADEGIGADSLLYGLGGGAALALTGWLAWMSRRRKHPRTIPPVGTIPVKTPPPAAPDKAPQGKGLMKGLHLPSLPLMGKKGQTKPATTPPPSTPKGEAAAMVAGLGAAPTPVDDSQNLLQRAMGLIESALNHGDAPPSAGEEPPKTSPKPEPKSKEPPPLPQLQTPPPATATMVEKIPEIPVVPPAPVIPPMTVAPTPPKAASSSASVPTGMISLDDILGDLAPSAMMQSSTPPSTPLVELIPSEEGIVELDEADASLNMDDLNDLAPEKESDASPEVDLDAEITGTEMNLTDLAREMMEDAEEHALDESPPMEINLDQGREEVDLTSLSAGMFSSSVPVEKNGEDHEISSDEVIQTLPELDLGETGLDNLASDDDVVRLLQGAPKLGEVVDGGEEVSDLTFPSADAREGAPLPQLDGLEKIDVSSAMDAQSLLSELASSPAAISSDEALPDLADALPSLQEEPPVSLLPEEERIPERPVTPVTMAEPPPVPSPPVSVTLELSAAGTDLGVPAREDAPPVAMPAFEVVDLDFVDPATPPAPKTEPKPAAKSGGPALEITLLDE